MADFQLIPKSVFISYRRTNIPWALNVFQYLTQHGYDVFFDFEGIGAGDFEQIIVGNILSRAHFLVILTPSALERCADPNDWLRREIETAIESKRNIVPLLLEGFDFGSPAIASQLTGKLAALKSYNGLGLPAEYFLAAMEKLRTKFLNVHPDAILHPAPATATQAAVQQAVAAAASEPVSEKQLTAQEYFERAYASADPEERIRLYTESIRLAPDAIAYYNRGHERHLAGDLDSALADYDHAIELNAEFAGAYYNRGLAKHAKGNLEAALTDYDDAIRLRPKDADAYRNRGLALMTQGNLDGAIIDFNSAIRVKSDHVEALYGRAIAHQRMANSEEAIKDCDRAIGLRPDFSDAYYIRGLLLQEKGIATAAVKDLRTFLDLRGKSLRDETEEQVEWRIREIEMAQQDAVRKAATPPILP